MNKKLALIAAIGLIGCFLNNNCAAHRNDSRAIENLRRAIEQRVLQPDVVVEALAENPEQAEIQGPPRIVRGRRHRPRRVRRLGRIGRPVRRRNLLEELNAIAREEEDNPGDLPMLGDLPPQPFRQPQERQPIQEDQAWVQRRQEIFDNAQRAQQPNIIRNLLQRFRNINLNRQN